MLIYWSILRFFVSHFCGIQHKTGRSTTPVWISLRLIKASKIFLTCYPSPLEGEGFLGPLISIAGSYDIMHDMEEEYPHQQIYYHGKYYVAIGWREWVSLPELGIRKIKAKIDTGARTSALHAFGIERFRKHGLDKLRFDIHPLQRNEKKIVHCVADLKDIRVVTDSGGRKENRYVIETPFCLGGVERSIEITLTNRSLMTFRMLLGRKALQHFFIVDPAISFRT